jgi:hypothetical protein
MSRGDVYLYIVQLQEIIIKSFKKNKNVRKICTSSFSLLDPCGVSCFLQYGVQLGWSKVLAAPV